MCLGPKNFAVHKSPFFGVRRENERKKCWNFLSDWLARLDVIGIPLLLPWLGAAQAYFSAHHTYFLAHLRRTVYMECTLGSKQPCCN